jgi:hypothetical protein
MMGARRHSFSNERPFTPVLWPGNTFLLGYRILIKPSDVTWTKDQVGPFKPPGVSRITGVADRDRYSASGALAAKRAHKPKRKSRGRFLGTSGAHRIRRCRSAVLAAQEPALNCSRSSDRF